MKYSLELNFILVIVIFFSGCATSSKPIAVPPITNQIYVGVSEKLIFDPGFGWKVEEKASFRNVNALRFIRYVKKIESVGAASNESFAMLAFTKDMPLHTYPERIRKVEDKVCPASALKLSVISQDERSIVIETTRTPCAIPYKTDRLLLPERQIVRIIDGEKERFELRYTASEELMTPASRDYWITRLMSATLNRM